MDEKKYKTISKTEIEDFEKVCRNYGLSPEEFTISEHDTTIVTSGIFPITGEITISKNGISRTYKNGNNTHWVITCENDIKQGIFNKK